MYYITNHNDQIIAADENLLQSLNIQTIDDLIKDVLLKEITFNKNISNELQIITSSKTYSYTISHTPLSSMLGELYLTHLELIEDSTQEKDLPDLDRNTQHDSLITNIVQEGEEPVSLNEEELFDLSETKENSLNNTQSEENINQDLLDNNNELFDLSETKESAFNHNQNLNSHIKEPDITDDAVFDLTSPIEATNDVSLNDNELLDSTPIIINIKEVSQDIGISDEDYKTFLNDYIDTAIALEEELQSDHEKERLSAMDTLTQLADVLQLPKVNTIIGQINTIPAKERPNLVESFYQTLSRLTTKEENVKTDTQLLDTTASELTETDKLPLAEEITKSPSHKGFGKLYLEDVKPIHFDFQLEAAANDLSLPIELIEEFVHDFIEQGHIETKKMIQAYEEGDLDTIQKIGHLLKGASSNLRINPLSDTLYDIQFCEDSDKLEDLIERYWAHFISFEQQIDMITKQ